MCNGGGGGGGGGCKSFESNCAACGLFMLVGLMAPAALTSRAWGEERDTGLTINTAEGAACSGRRGKEWPLTGCPDILLSKRLPRCRCDGGESCRPQRDRRDGVVADGTVIRASPLMRPGNADALVPEPVPEPEPVGPNEVTLLVLPKPWKLQAGELDPGTGTGDLMLSMGR